VASPERRACAGPLDLEIGAVSDASSDVGGPFLSACDRGRVSGPPAGRLAAAWEADPRLPPRKGRAASRLRRSLIGAGTASTGLSLARLWLSGVSLPFDRIFDGVVGLMWPRTGLGVNCIGLVFRGLDLACFSLPVVLGIGALLAAWRERPPAIVRLAYEFALVLPLLAFVASDLSRWIANAIYAAAPLVSADYTAVLARLEGSTLARLQTALAGDSLSQVCEVIYSSGWLLALMLAVPLFAMSGRPRAVNSLLAGWIFAPLLALPFFLLFPVFEPWAVNPLYGYGAPGESSVRFLTAGAPSISLLAIAAHVHWATGACIPSMHVVLPAFVSRVGYEEGARWLGRIYAVAAGLVAFTVIYLGRHWIVDVIVAVPFAVVVARLAARFAPRLVLSWPPVSLET